MGSKGDISREKILQAAAGIFHRQGFATTTVEDLLRATGTTKGKLYFHFAGKEAICLEVLRREQALFLHFLDATLTGTTPGAGIDNFFRQALAKNRDRHFIGGCLFGNTALEASDTAPALATLVTEVFAAWVGKILVKVQQAQTLGEIRRDLPPAQLAELIVATVEGGIMQARLQKDEGPLARILDSLRALLELNVDSEKKSPKGKQGR